MLLFDWSTPRHSDVVVSIASLVLRIAVTCDNNLVRKSQLLGDLIAKRLECRNGMSPNTVFTETLTNCSFDSSEWTSLLQVTRPNPPDAVITKAGKILNRSNSRKVWSRSLQLSFFWKLCYFSIGQLRGIPML